MLAQRLFCVVGIMFSFLMAAWAEAVPSPVLRNQILVFRSFPDESLRQSGHELGSDVLSLAKIGFLERLTEYGKWMEGLDHVASGTRSTDIYALSAFIRERLFAVDMTRPSSEWSVGPIPLEDILVINLLPDERLESVDPQGRIIVIASFDEAVVTYVRSSRRSQLILANPWVLSPMARGLFLLRMAHAVHVERFPAEHLNIESGGCQIGPAMEWARMLMDTFAAFGGESYHALLERAAEWYLEGVKLRENRIIPSRRLDREFEKVFGPTASEQELALRRLTWHTQVYFRIFARIFSSSEEARAVAQRRVVKDLFGADWCR